MGEVAMTRHDYARWAAESLRQDPEALAAFEVGLLDVPEDVEQHLTTPQTGRGYVPADAVTVVSADDAA